MSKIALCQRVHTNASRNENQDYVRTVHSFRDIKDASAAAFVSANPTHPWSDPGSNEYIVDIDPADAAALESAGLYHGGNLNLPKWQQATDVSGGPADWGSYADPTDGLSPFTSLAPLADDRLIVRLYDDDPSTVGVHLDLLEMDEGESAGERTVYLKLFSSNDVALTTNAQNQKTQIAGKLMIFDFTDGVSTFGINTNSSGSVRFPSSRSFRIVTPSAKNSVLFTVYGRTLVPR